MDCVFCQIISRRLPASFIYEDDKVAAFLDIHPINQGHVLVVPKRHESRFGHLTEDEAAYLFRIGRKVLRAIQKSEIKCEGTNLFLSDGPVAGQEVMHSHLHIVPRFKGDGQRVGFNHSDPEQYPRTRLDEIAIKIAGCISEESHPQIMTQPIVETERLTLEPVKESDLPDIFAYASDPEVTKYLTWDAHKTVEDSRAFLQFVRQSTRTVRGQLFFVFAIRLKSSGQVIGTIDFKNINRSIGQIDYALASKNWGYGLMTEAAQAVRDWVFLSLPEVIRLQAFCVPENIGSARVMEKIGMTREGLRKKAFVLKGRPVDLVDYAVINEKYIDR